MPKRNIEAEMSAKEDKYRAEREAELEAFPAYREMMKQREAKKLFVRPVAGQRVPLMGGGGYYPEEGVEVSADNVYVHRRLRDGTMELAEQPAEQPEPTEEATADEQPPAEEPEAKQQPTTTRGKRTAEEPQPAA